VLGVLFLLDAAVNHYRRRRSDADSAWDEDAARERVTSRNGRGAARDEPRPA
jgi:hypothetical protein